MRKMIIMALALVCFIPMAFTAFESKASRSNVYTVYHWCCLTPQGPQISDICLPGGTDYCREKYCIGIAYCL